MLIDTRHKKKKLKPKPVCLMRCYNDVVYIYRLVYYIWYNYLIFACEFGFTGLLKYLKLVAEWMLDIHRLLLDVLERERVFATLQREVHYWTCFRSNYKLYSHFNVASLFLRLFTRRFGFLWLRLKFVPSREKEKYKFLFNFFLIKSSLSFFLQRRVFKYKEKSKDIMIIIVYITNIFVYIYSIFT